MSKPGPKFWKLAQLLANMVGAHFEDNVSVIFVILLTFLDVGSCWYK